MERDKLELGTPVRIYRHVNFLIHEYEQKHLTETDRRGKLSFEQVSRNRPVEHTRDTVPVESVTS